jgi:hypothetical protein
MPMLCNHTALIGLLIKLFFNSERCMLRCKYYLHAPIQIFTQNQLGIARMALAQQKV